MKVFFSIFLATCAMARIVSAQEAVVQLGHGVNFGDMLEAKTEGAWGATARDEYFPLVKQAGFGVIRIPIGWCLHVAAAPDYTIDPVFLARVDHVIAQAEKNNLQVILDYHSDDDMTKDPDAYEARYLAIWKQLAAHFQGAPDSVLLELFNEPHAKLDGPRWNALLAKTLPIVRANNPTRTVVVGPTNWNNTGFLSQLVLPENDQHLLVTVHFYDPMTFTHQGASWVAPSQAWLGTTWQGTDAEKLAVTQTFDQAAAWAKAQHRPIFLGEFGAYEKGDMASRARWTSFVARTAEAHGLPWLYWEFCSSFGVYDPQAKAWRQPLLEALLPK
jgi:endoglucanase